jgi:hypothetical protein
MTGIYTIGLVILLADNNRFEERGHLAQNKKIVLKQTMNRVESSQYLIWLWSHC